MSISVQHRVCSNNWDIQSTTSYRLFLLYSILMQVQTYYIFVKNTIVILQIYYVQRTVSCRSFFFFIDEKFIRSVLRHTWNIGTRNHSYDKMALKSFEIIFFLFWYTNASFYQYVYINYIIQGAFNASFTIDIPGILQLKGWRPGAHSLQHIRI